MARARKLAIWPRVTLSLGQNWVLAGGLHPVVIPAVASLRMSFSNTLPSSSVNSAVPVSVRL
jgi:hypothetical protein